MRLRLMTLGLLFSLAGMAQRVDLSQLKPVQLFAGLPPGAVYADASKTPDERTKDILKRLSFEEKLRLSGGFANFCFPGIERLGLRAATMADASQGVRLSSITSKAKSTSFPGMQAMAASFNPDLAKIYGTNIAEECQMHGVDILLGPGINMQRHSVSGRNFEYMGEDPLLTGIMATAYIQGLQSKKILATAKHFIANDQEFCRHIASSDLDERTLREIYLRPWEMAVKQGHVMAIMAGNNLVNNIPASMHQPLLNDVMRKEFGFRGMSMTDWQNTNYHESIQYLVAGSGMSLLMPVNATFASYVNGFVKMYPTRKAEMEKEIEDMIYPNLYALFAMGVYDRAPIDPSAASAFASHKETARRVAGEAIVLLKNEQNILPLSIKQSILLAGADELHSGKGSGFVEGYDHVNFEKGLREIWGDKLTVNKKPSDEEIKQAGVVLFRFNKESGEGEDIPFEEDGGQGAEIKRIAALNPNLIVLVSSANGFPMEWLPQTKGLLWTFMLGQERGHALADVLSGKISPSGHLPFTLETAFKLSAAPKFNYLGGKPYWHGNNNFYKDYWKGEEPDSKKEIAKYILPHQYVHIPYNEGVFMGYRWFNKTGEGLLFPFGYGLSYSSFSWGVPALSTETMKDSIVMTMTVRNTGKRAAAELVQVYIQDLESSVARPVRELKAFQKTNLAPGKSATLRFVIKPEDLAFWDNKLHSWKIEPGRFKLITAHNARDLVNEVEFSY